MVSKRYLQRGALCVLGGGLVPSSIVHAEHSKQVLHAAYQQKQQPSSVHHGKVLSNQAFP
jgi:hypothetical protein